MKETSNRLTEESDHHKKTSEYFYKELVNLKKRGSGNLTTTIILSEPAILTFPNDRDLIPFTADLFGRLTKHQIKATEIMAAERFGKPSVPNIPERRSIKVKLRSREVRSNIISIVL